MIQCETNVRKTHTGHNAVTEEESAVAAWIREEIDKRGWSQRQLARKANMAPGALNDILTKPDRVPRERTLEKLTAVLGTPPWQFEAPEENRETGFKFIDPNEIKGIFSGEAVEAVKKSIAEEPDRWAVAQSRPGQHGADLLNPTSGPTLYLIDRRAELHTGAVVAVRSPRGDGLRYMADPFLVGGTDANGQPGHDIRGAAGVQVVGKLAATLVIAS